MIAMLHPNENIIYMSDELFHYNNMYKDILKIEKILLNKRFSIPDISDQAYNISKESFNKISKLIDPSYNDNSHVNIQKSLIFYDEIQDMSFFYIKSLELTFKVFINDSNRIKKSDNDFIINKNYEKEDKFISLNKLKEAVRISYTHDADTKRFFETVLNNLSRFE